MYEVRLPVGIDLAKLKRLLQKFIPKGKKCNRIIVHITYLVCISSNITARKLGNPAFILVQTDKVGAMRPHHGRGVNQVERIDGRQQAL